MNAGVPVPLIRAAALGAAVALGACGGGKSAPAGTADMPATANGVQGAVTKGPVANAQVEVFRFDAGGAAIGNALASVATDANGRFSVSGLPTNEPFLVVSDGGVYRDEADKRGQRQVVLSPGQGFESILVAGASSVALNPYTQALVDKVRAEASGGDTFLSLLQSNRTIFAGAFGFDVLTTIPADPIAPTGSNDAIRYAMAIGGAANAINAMSAGVDEPAASYDTVRAFATDLSDGQLDGTDGGTPLTGGPTSQPYPDVDINLEIRRFFNNNDDAYAGFEPVEIDEAALSQAGSADPGANRAPVVDDDAYAVNEDDQFAESAPGVLGNDFDPDGQNLQAQLVSAPQYAVNFSLNVDGSFNYEHDGTEVASDSFTYTASDGSTDSATATVVITINAVNDPPQVTTNQVLFVDPGATALIDDTRLKATDPDNTPAELSFTQTTGPACGGFQVGGSAATSFTQAQIDAGSVLFDATGCAGDEMLTADLDLTDASGGGPVSLTFAVTVNGATNQAPVNVLPPGPLAVFKGDPTALAGISVSDPDADPAADSFSFQLSVVSGTLSIRTDVPGGVQAGDVAGNGSATLTVNAVPDAFNLTLASTDGLSYQPAPGFSGADTLTLDSNDNGATGTGGAAADNDQLTLHVQLLDPDTGDPARGLRLDGEASGRFAGGDVSDIGDFNGDGVSDLLVVTGAQPGGDDPPQRAYVVFGNAAISAADFNLADLNSGFLSGIVIDADADRPFSIVADGGADMNNDGLADFAIAYDEAGGDDNGVVYVFFGTATPTASIDATALDGTDGFRVDGGNSERAGSGVAFVPDLDGDGFDELLIGAQTSGVEGSAYLMYGSAAPPSAVVSLADLSDGTTGVRIRGENFADGAGTAVRVGDYLVDGVPDLVIAAPFTDVQMPNSGSVYIVDGNAVISGAGTINLADLNPGEVARIDGQIDSGWLGLAIGGAGDINGDGNADLAIVEFGAPGSGLVHILYGNAVLPAVLTPSDLNGTNGFSITANGGDVFALGVGLAGNIDVDGDALPDLLLGDPFANPGGLMNRGSVFVLRGRMLANPFPALFDLSADDGSEVLRINGPTANQYFGWQIDRLGDFDLDGAPDIAIGAPIAPADGAVDAGLVYLLFEE